MAGWHSRGPIDRFVPLEIAKFPFYLENVLVIILFSVMFMIACVWAMLPAGMGIRSVTFWFICVTLFTNYCFVIVEHTSQGKERVPKLSGDLVFPTHDARLYMVAALTVAYLAGYAATDEGAARITYSIVMFITYPVMFSFVVITKSYGALFNPVKLLGALVIFGLSAKSLKFYGLQLLVGGFLVYEISVFGEVSGWHVLWAVPVTLIGLFMLFRALGVLLNANAQRLGIAIHRNEETYKQALQEEEAQQLQKVVTDLYTWVRVHEYDKAWKQLAPHIDAHNIDKSADIFQRLCQWDDKKLAIKMGLVFVEHLVREDDVDRALKIFENCYGMAGGNLKLPSGKVALTLAARARNEVVKTHLHELLWHFEEDFPNHPQTLDALILRARLTMDLTEDTAAAIADLKAAQALDQSAKKREEFREVFHTVRSKKSGKGKP